MKRFTQTYDVELRDKSTRTVTNVIETMTVGDLKQKLAEYPDETPVFAHWEGQRKEIKPDKIELDTFTLDPDPNAWVQAVWIDVD